MASFLGFHCCCSESDDQAVERTVLDEREGAPAGLVEATSLGLDAPASPDIEVCESISGAHKRISLSTSIADEKTWEIHLVKGSSPEPLGLDLMIDRKQQLSVLSRPIKAGLVKTWNTDHPEESVTAGDILESINGFQGPAKELLDAIKKAPTNITIRMRRLIRCDVVVRCTAGNLGLELREHDGALVIESVLEEGDVRKANSRCLAGQQVAPGHMIVKINDQSGDAEKMVSLLQEASGDVTLSLYRPPGAPFIS